MIPINTDISGLEIGILNASCRFIYSMKKEHDLDDKGGFNVTMTKIPTKKHGYFTTIEITGSNDKTHVSPYKSCVYIQNGTVTVPKNSSEATFHTDAEYLKFLNKEIPGLDIEIPDNLD
ncbi:hypothetical protein KY308_00980 [Candidatus Woesearchaeota archaeon]|nr:hypothetical protein [Candidatus Woesearchaeota archaeon]